MFIKLTTTEAIGKTIRVNMDRVFTYVGDEVGTKITNDGGFIRYVQETPEEIDRLIAEARHD